jgi:hypothetical protein
LPTPLLGDEPASRPAPLPEKPPIHVFLKDPADLGALWTTLSQPDYVILNGVEYARLLSRLSAAAASEPSGAVVESVVVRGVVNGERAELAVDLSISLLSDPPSWIPVGLNGLILDEARSEGQVIPVRAASGTSWEVQLQGKGKHRVTLELTVPIKQIPEGRTFALAIREAASTRLSIELPAGASDVFAGPAEGLRATPLASSSRLRVNADLTPRSKLSLLWSEHDTSRGQSPFLLSARGEISIELDSDSLKTRSSWSIRSIRGATRSLELMLDPEDKVLDLELDGQPAKFQLERVASRNQLTLSLPEPLSVGRERRVVLVTRRVNEAGRSTEVQFHGFPLSHAREETGTIGITRGPNLWISGSANQGVRQIDPRTELPDDLRARPATELAYQFAEQPFDLTLRVEASPPQVQVESRTTITLEPASARNDTWLDFRIVRGRAQELEFHLAHGLELESAEPESLVASVHSSRSSNEEPKSLTIRLNPRALESGRFGLHLVGRQSLGKPGPQSIGLFQPVGVASSGGRVAVVTSPSMTAVLDPPGDSLSAFRTAVQPLPADWPWPDGRVQTPGLWLRHDEVPPALPLATTFHERVVSNSTALTVQVERTAIEILQETELNVRFGPLEPLTLLVPHELERRWSSQGNNVIVGTELDVLSDTHRSVPLRISASAGQPVKLRFRYRLPIPSPTAPHQENDMEIPWLRIAETTPGRSSLRASLTPDAGVRVEGRGRGWGSSGENSADEDASTLLRFQTSTEDPTIDRLGFRVTRRELEALPSLIVSRLLLDTVIGSDGDSWTTASFWTEVHGSSFAVALPEGAKLLTAKVAGENVGEVEEILDRSGYRLTFPSRIGSAPTLIEIAYSQSSQTASGVLEAPLLLDGGLAQECYWKVQIPWNRALLVNPEGWTDENEWFWYSYLWSLRSRIGATDLARWLQGTKTEGVESRAKEIGPRSGGYALLFGRQGSPVNLKVMLASRSWLVAICSGVVLAIGAVFLLLWRPPVWFLTASAILLSAVAILLDIHQLVVLVQSAAVGLFLTILIAVMQRVVERRRFRSVVFVEPSSRTSSFNRGSTPIPSAGVGSDDPTAIRPRDVVSPHSDAIMIPGSTASAVPRADVRVSSEQAER